MTIAVKICGINDAAGFDTAIAAGADWVGFVFADGSPRQVDAALAARLSARHAGGPPRVGLFVRPTAPQVAAVLDHLALDILQIYAPPAQAAALGAQFGRPVWTAFGVASASDLPTQMAGAARLLLESRAASNALPGGNGQAMNWALLHGWAAPGPWILAGGLTPGNVAAAIAATGATAVDVSSGVESRRGVKDPALIRAFIGAVRAAEPA